MALEIKYYADEARLRAGNAARWGGGWLLRQIMNIAAGGGSINIANLTREAIADKTSIWTALGKDSVSYAFGVVSLGLGTGLQAYLNHREMEHREHLITDLYRKEIGSRLGKEPALVTEKDLYAVATAIPTLQEELDRNRKQMRLDTSSWLIGAIGSLAAVIGTITLFALTGGWALVVGVAVGYVAHQLVEDTAQSVGAAVMKIDQESTLDKIRTMENSRQLGRKISPEQVMSVYAAATPHLNTELKNNPEFGMPFDQLSIPAKHRAVHVYGQSMNIMEVTNALNTNQMSARELAFRVHGEVSGAYPEPTMYQTMQAKLAGVKQSIASGKAAASEKWNGLVSRFSKKENEVAQEEEALAEPSTESKWTNRITQEREAAALRATSPQIG